MARGRLLSLALLIALGASRAEATPVGEVPHRYVQIGWSPSGDVALVRFKVAPGQGCEERGRALRECTLLVSGPKAVAWEVGDTSTEALSALATEHGLDPADLPDAASFDRPRERVQAPGSNQRYYRPAGAKLWFSAGGGPGPDGGSLGSGRSIVDFANSACESGLGSGSALNLRVNAYFTPSGEPGDLRALGDIESFAMSPPMRKAALVVPVVAVALLAGLVLWRARAHR